MLKRLNLQIEGIVQGVGFRPFVFSLAHANSLSGWVLNNSRGVEIEIEGPDESLNSFLCQLEKKPPPLSRIISIKRREITPAGGITFSILESKELSDRVPFISPDTDVCDDCIRELFDPADRRYCYPFINCTNCGPRYTIIKDIPYDRDKTTMQPFLLCSECSREYHDPLDRRFHAQPIGCWKCGPRLALCDESGQNIAAADPLQKTIELLLVGRIAAIKGLGGFHLAVDAASEEAVLRLRARKHREEKPFAIMVRDIEQARRICFITEQEEDILTSKLKPILLLRKKPGHGIAEAVAPRNPFFGIMLPYTPVHHLLLKNTFSALVMTSANITDEPITKENQESLTRLKGIADFFLMHNRDIHVRADDSIMRSAAGSLSILRRSRGMVPLGLPLIEDGIDVLACGAELKNALCFTKEKVAYLSQYIGDMESAEAERIFLESIEHLKNILQVTPEAIAYDLHPGYRATRYALDQSHVRTVGVQHHFAHVASCLAEHGVDGPAIGVAFDGTGYGDDGAIWGSEFFTFDYSGYRRRAHFDYMPLPGGDAAAREPYRMAISYLYRTYKDKMRELELPLLIKYADRLQPFITMMNKKINSPVTSSCGRLFDAVASLTGLRDVMSFEGQAPMELEMAIDEPHELLYPYQVAAQDAGTDFIISFEAMITGIVDDISRSKTASFISCCFHNTIAQVIADICERISQREGIKLVALSGGVFQNLYLLTRTVDLLRQRQFRVLTHEQVPTNDGGIALGQAVIARRACKL
jgi:hydrogenase maturation protein HypF